jgi:nicotinamidase-related amidase
MVELIPELAEFAPPARVFDKHVYSPWVEEGLDVMLEGVEALIVSGGETDVCVLATVLGAVDRGYRVIVAQDALCSSSDESHDHLTELYHRRFGQQIETAEVGEILANW